MSLRPLFLLGVCVGLSAVTVSVVAQTTSETPIPEAHAIADGSHARELLSSCVALRPTRSTPRPAEPTPPPSSASASEPNPSEQVPSPATPVAAPAPSAAATPAATSSPEAANAGVDFSAADVWAEHLSPRQRAELESLVDAIPRYHADAFEDGFLAKAGATVFPEMSFVRVGKVTLAGGLVTAIKQRNPFGLLNPLIFGMSW